MVRREYINNIHTNILIVFQHSEEPGGILGMLLVGFDGESHDSLSRSSGHKLSIVAQREKW